MAKKRTRVTDLECTAYHEAGHAAIAFVLRRAVKLVTIMPNAEAGTLGHVRKGDFSDSFRPDANKDPRTRSLVEREIIISLAGPAAEAKYKGHRNNIGACGDYHDAVDLAMHVCVSVKETHRYLAWLAVRAEEQVDVALTWAGIEALAKALLLHHCLSGRAARAVFDEGRNVLLRAEGICPIKTLAKPVAGRGRLPSSATLR
jgi:hypothetical protein